ncbi:hypothetical protein JN12_01242 [Geobacter argillaceus]|uniref:Uncharacterized protein n=1 Tax=Geobacter argillaceus TaxID=345631 RepID=A0A562W8E6_9BACT|nr:hypothetical protein JN12_01242 [Geobacter argillaceus]
MTGYITVKPVAEFIMEGSRSNEKGYFPFRSYISEPDASRRGVDFISEVLETVLVCLKKAYNMCGNVV